MNRQQQQNAMFPQVSSSQLSEQVAAYITCANNRNGKQCICVMTTINIDSSGFFLSLFRIFHELFVLQVSQEVLIYFSTIFFSLTKLCADLKWKKQKNNSG